MFSMDNPLVIDISRDLQLNNIRKRPLELIRKYKYTSMQTIN